MKQLLIMAFVLLQTTVASAQEGIENFVKKIQFEEGVAVLTKSDKTIDCPDGGVSYCKFIEFVIPDKRKSLLKDAEKTLTFSQSKAYSTYIKKEGGNNSLAPVSGHDILYGVNNEYKVTLGSNKTHNYYAQCFTDPNDSIRRHAYCFVWFKDAANYHCYYYHIYGVKPAMFDVYKAGLAQNADGNVDDKSGRGAYTRTLSNGKVVLTQTYDSDGNLMHIESLPQVLSNRAEVNTDTDFMLQFGNLRAAFLDAIKEPEAKTLPTGIVVKIVRLCKEHGKLLSENEKHTCVNSIVEMSNTLKKTNADTFMDGMLQEAKNVLSK